MADSPQATLALARTGAGAVRSLNHATLGGEGLAQLAAAALARDLGHAQQQLAAVHGSPAPEEEGEF